MPTVRTSHVIQVKHSTERVVPIERAPNHSAPVRAAVPLAPQSPINASTGAAFNAGHALAAQRVPRASLAMVTPFGFAGAAATRLYRPAASLSGALSVPNIARAMAPVINAARRLPLGRVAAFMLMPNEVGQGSYISPSTQPKHTPQRHQNPESLLRDAHAQGASTQLQTYPPPRGVTIEFFPDDSDSAPTVHRGKEGAPDIAVRPIDGTISMPPDPSLNMHAGGQTRTKQENPRGFKEHTFDVRDFFHLARPHTDPSQFDWYSGTMKPGQKPPSLKFKHIEIKSSNLYHPSEMQHHFPPNKTVRLDFRVGSKIGGHIDIRWLEPEMRRDTVVVDYTHSTALPEVPAGEVLAHALSLESGFVPAQYLLLKLKHTQSEASPRSGTPYLVAQTALGLLGKQAKQGLFMPGLHDHVSMEVVPQFRSLPKYFDAIRTDIDDSLNGSRLDDPKRFPNLYPHNDPGLDMQLLTPEQLAQHGGLEPGETLDTAKEQNAYVVVLGQNGMPELRLGRALRTQGHFTLANGQPVLAAGIVHMIYDTDLRRYRVQHLDDDSGHYRTYGHYAKQIAEHMFEQAGLGGLGRWLPKFSKPVNTHPFAGLTVTRRPLNKLEDTLLVNIPDLDISLHTKLTHDGQHLLEIERIDWGRQEHSPAHQVSPKAFPSLLGQALASTAADIGLPFKGIKVSADLLETWGEKAVIDGLTMYGIDTRQIIFSSNLNSVIDAGTQYGIKTLRLNGNTPAH